MTSRSVIKELQFRPTSRPGTLNGIPSLRQCQIETPTTLVDFVWKRVLEKRPHVDSVIDLGAGDGRFSLAGRYRSYIGYEVDSTKYNLLNLPSEVIMINQDVLQSHEKCDVSIGNPPFIRHQDISDEWKKTARKMIQEKIGVKVNGLSNLYQYFMWLSLLRTKESGIISLIVPFEWIFRPSSSNIRDFIRNRGWNVDIYKLPQGVHFRNIAAVPSLTIIDKSTDNGEINFHYLNENMQVDKGEHTIIGINQQFQFSKRNKIVYAQRGFSTGSQKYFVLTEKERVENGIKRSEVVPCITSLRELNLNDEILDESHFKSHFVNSGHKCWLIVTEKGDISRNLRKYLKSIPEGVRQNWTCRNRDLWYHYKTPKVPVALYACSFNNGNRPKVVRNDVKARNISAVHGIYIAGSVTSTDSIIAKLKTVDFVEGILPTVNNLRKIEVRQMNGILSKIVNEMDEGVAEHD